MLFFFRNIFLAQEPSLDQLIILMGKSVFMNLKVSQKSIKKICLVKMVLTIGTIYT